jgi:hypothetical protein
MLHGLRLRSILFVTQVLSAAILFYVSWSVYTHHSLSTAHILFLVFLGSLFKQYFDIARESYSKHLGSSESQRSLQAQILQGLYSAQLAGPLFALLCIWLCPLWVPFLLDALTFLATGFAAFLLKDSTLLFEGRSILKPLIYLKSNAGLRTIFLLRSIGYWIPIAIYNYLLFSVVTEKFKLGIEHTALIYSVTGLGSLFSATWLRMKSQWIFAKVGSLSDAKIAALSLLALAFNRVALLYASSFVTALFVLWIGGFFNGFNAVTTQSLRRKLTTHSQFGEIVALESLVGKLTDWGAGTIAALLLTRHWITYEQGIYISAFLLLPLAALHLVPSLGNNSID